MRFVLFMNGDSDAWITVVIFIIVGISVLANIVKKVMQGAQKFQDEEGKPAKPRSRFFDLIEEVRRMAEKEGGQDPDTTDQPPPFIKIERTNQKRTLIPPAVPKLKPIGDTKSPEVSSSRQRVRSYAVEKPVAARLVSMEDELADEEEVAIAAEAKKRYEAKQRELKIRQDAMRKAERRRQEPDWKSERKKDKYTAEKHETAVVPLQLREITDYGAALKSADSLREAIVLREILGPPKAMQRHRKYSRIQ